MARNNTSLFPGLPPRFWEIPELTGWQRLPGSTVRHRLPGDVDPFTDDPAMHRLSLDGTWGFRLFPHPEAVTPDCFTVAPKTNGRNWGTIETPSNWTRQGYDKPHYVNWKMPFAGEPPETPDDNPTGVYVRRFDVPAAWKQRRVVIRFEGVESCYAVYLNGEAVGVGKDSRVESEFDLTAAIRPGSTNVVTVVVMRWSDGSYLEDQDHWRMAGIYRPVWIYTTAPTHLRDVRIQSLPTLDLTTGEFEATIEVGFAGTPEEGWAVRAQLYRPDGKAVFRKPLEGSIDVSHGYNVWPRMERTLYGRVRRPKLWSAEQPQRYTAVAQLVAPDGVVVEQNVQRIGFRRIEIADQELRVNGVAVPIYGANRHEHDERHGKTVSRELMIRDIELLKQHNFNAVRCAHYPNTHDWYDLCDEYGLYLFDEANVESHAFMQHLVKMPRYAPAVLDRIMRLVARTRNHPAIIAWSMGNESGTGAIFDAAANWIRHADPTRPVHYGGAVHARRDYLGEGKYGYREPFHLGRAATDIICPMYTDIERLDAFRKEHPDDPRPFILCEYSHAMGNSNGSLHDYFAAFARNHGLQGGFIWDWVDQGLLEHAADGTPYYTYGGDYGDVPNDVNFNCNGLVGPDRTPHPACREHHKLAQPLEITLASARARRVAVTNRQSFTDLRWLKGSWELLLDGVPVANGSLARRRSAPGETVSWDLPYTLPSVSEGREVHLLIRFHAAEAQPWCPAGHLVAWEQFTLRAWKQPRRHRVTGTAPEVSEDGEQLVLTVGHQTLTFDRPHAELVRLHTGNETVLTSGPSLNLMRAPTDNDGIKQWSGQEDKPLGRWLAAGLDELMLADASLAVAREGSRVVIQTTQIWQASGRSEPASWETHYALHPDGTLDLDHVLTVPETWPDLPRAGVVLTLPDPFEQLRWFGRGPHESYWDRQAGAPLAVHASTVRDQYVPYVMPQEHGNKTAVRWLELTGRKLQFRATAISEPLEMNATRYPAEVLFNAFHTCELSPSDYVTLTIDWHQRGLGTGSCGPDTRPDYLLPPGQTYRFSWRLAVNRG